MLENAKVCLYPKNPEEAVRILEQEGKRALILAGGTTASQVRDPNVTTLVDITRMAPPADTVNHENGEWSIGCNVRIQQLASHTGLKRVFCGMLCDAALSVGSRPLRNAVTAGGNAVSVFRWSDPPVALLALDASFDLVGPGRERTLAADTFYSRHPRRILKPAEILTRIRVSEPAGRYGGAFCKFARTAFDLAVVDVAVCLWFEGDICSRARVAIGATRNVPWLSENAAEMLAGKRLTGQSILAAARAAREETKTADDIRTSREYREQMVEVMVRRTIERACDNAMGV
jgi:CO/xanthine dehydrogenase FAD-binding subunit